MEIGALLVQLEHSSEGFDLTCQEPILITQLLIVTLQLRILSFQLRQHQRARIRRRRRRLHRAEPRAPPLAYWSSWGPGDSRTWLSPPAWCFRGREACLADIVWIFGTLGRARTRARRNHSQRRPA